MLIKNLKLKKQTQVAQTMQIFDLLELSQREKEMCDFCMASLMQLAQWKKTMSCAIHPLVMGKMRIKGNILRNQAKGAMELYKAARRDRITNFECYINALPQGQSFKRLAS